MAHAASHTATAITTKEILWDITGGSGQGPHEWTFETDVAADLYLSGVYPGADAPIRILAGEKFTFLSVNRGITKVEAASVSGTATINLRPTAV